MAKEIIIDLDDAKVEDETETTESKRNKAREAHHESKETEEFDAEAALDTEGFANFLAKFPDSKEGETDFGFIEERFEVFQLKNEVAESLKEVWSNDISKEIGIQLSEQALSCINKYVEQEAVDSPRTVLEMRDQLELHQELPKQIEAMQADINELTKTAEIARGGTGFFGSIKMYAGLLYGGLRGKYTKGTETYYAQKIMQSQGIPVTREALATRLESLDEETGEVQSEFGQLQEKKEAELEELRQRYADIHQELFAHIGIRQEITAAANQRLKLDIRMMADGRNLESFSKALWSLADRSEGEGSGLEYVSVAEEKEIQEQIDKEAERYIADVVKNKLKDMTLGSKAFTKLQDSLQELIEAPSAGMKDARETREFVVKTLIDSVKKLPEDEDGIAKRVLVRSLAAKLDALTPPKGYDSVERINI